MKRVGILGGTFDPPHIGHLIIAEEAKAALSLDKIWFLPTHIPPHKAHANIDVSHRKEMVNLALADNGDFEINTTELERLGKSYTFDTMKLLTEEHPDTQFYFIIGADMVEYLPHWYKVEALLELVSFIGVHRQGHQLNSNDSIIPIDTPTIDISSTDIRKRIQAKEAFRYYVPEPVYTYIKELHLYEG